MGAVAPRYHHYTTPTNVVSASRLADIQRVLYLQSVHKTKRKVPYKISKYQSIKHTYSYHVLANSKGETKSMISYHVITHQYLLAIVKATYWCFFLATFNNEKLYLETRSWFHQFLHISILKKQSAVQYSICIITTYSHQGIIITNLFKLRSIIPCSHCQVYSELSAISKIWKEWHTNL